ncbi:MAG: serine protease [Frankiales bacterium]|nr:serine protease [Frankiales bacterium]
MLCSVLVGALAAGVVAPGFASAGAAPPAAGPQDKLGQHDRRLLTKASDEGEKDVTVLLATRPGGASAAGAAVQQMGGRVGYRDDALGYVRATLPTAAVERAAALASVQLVDLDEQIAQEDPRQGLPPVAPAATPASLPVLGHQPADNPYLPVAETGAAAFRAANPTWDGRGVTIGVLDSGVDLDSPALQVTSTGQRKITDWVTATDPVADGDGSWVAMLDTVSGPSFNALGRSWTAPAGTYRFGEFSEIATLRGGPAGDVNRDGDTNDDFGILFRPADGAVWIDSDQDGSFTDGPLMRPYREQHQVGHFGVDNPATRIVERMPFVVEVRRDVDLAGSGLPGERADFVNIGLVASGHGTHVAGIAAAYGGALADGAAPGAQVVSSRACSWDGSCTAAALTEGMIDLVTRRGVDVVNMSIGGLPALNDGANAQTELYARLIARYGVQIFLSAGNDGPGLSSVGEPAAGLGVLSVGASISQQTWQADYGTVVRAPVQISNYSSRGPSESGGFQPSLVAPGSAVSTVPRWLPPADVPGVGYVLPPGYALYNGTSMAAPQVTGGAALLLSAAEQVGLPVSPGLLRKALLSSAVPLPGVAAAAQGMGRLSVPAAAALVRSDPHTAVLDYVVRAPVCTVLAAELADPGHGSGINNRCGPTSGGQAVGQSRSYPVTVTRTSGPSGGRRHTLSWRSNDGTFSAPGSVTLTRGVPATVMVTARPATAGAHSAVLQLDDPDSAGIEGVSLQTVVAATALVQAPFRAGLTATVERAGGDSLFVDVPAGAPTLRVDLSGLAADSRLRWVAYQPDGMPVEATDSQDCLTGGAGDATRCNPTSRSYDAPAPGVWELAVEASRLSGTLANPFTLTAALQGVTLRPPTQTLPTASRTRPTPVQWELVNCYAATSAGLRGGPLGSSRTQRPVVQDGQSVSSTVTVPVGATELQVELSNPTDPQADLDITLLRGGVVVATAAHAGSREVLRLPAPAPGAYQIRVEGYAVPSGRSGITVRDSVFAPAFGSLSSAGQSVQLPSRSTVPIRASLIAGPTAAGTGRQLVGRLSVALPSGTTELIGLVQVAAVA